MDGSAATDAALMTLTVTILKSDRKQELDARQRIL